MQFGNLSLERCRYGWMPYTGRRSMMILGVPPERKLSVGLKRITDPNDWWDFGVPVSGYLRP
jgi:hypothetical protein